MQLIALTGGIAAGKSTIGRRLEQLGAVRIDADGLARDAVAVGSPGLAAVLERFGAHLRLPEGGLDRAALGALVFDNTAALAELNAIVHPEVRRLAAERIAAIAGEHPGGVVVYEIPLFVESGSVDAFDWDLVVTGEAPVEMRVRRMVELRGMSEREARNRIANQADEAARRAVADVVIDTSGSEEETIAQVDALWRRLHESPSDAEA